MKTPVFDLAIIGGGINGCGIARDAAGRGLSVFLCEQNDLSSGTSSSSTKLIHGGLRYLEHYEFRLVREALKEREVLLNAAPHIITPLRFILPHHRGLRPAWLIRLGLFIYDNLGGRKILPGTSTVNLATDEVGAPLKANFKKGFEYSDCAVIDSRLVILNALDAAAKGADIRVQTKLESATRADGYWDLKLVEKRSGKRFSIKAKTLVNASGPWLSETLTNISLTEPADHMRLVKGSHIIVEKLFDHERAYIFQNNDDRIIFAIPHENKFTLIGTTDVDYSASPDEVKIDEEEVNYLCEAASEYFTTQISPKDVVSSFSGIRPLFDDGKNAAKSATRDYALKIDTEKGTTPLLSIYGGKITTYRKLAESVLDKLSAHLPTLAAPWTETACLPGGNFPYGSILEEIKSLLITRPILAKEHASRLVRTYGTSAHAMTEHIISMEDLGTYFGHDLFSFEVDYLIENEWAQCADDILWRRTWTGLFISPDQTRQLDEYIKEYLKN